MTPAPSLIKNLLFPTQCAGCGIWDWNLCPACADLARSVPLEGHIEDEQGRPDIRLLSLGPYAGFLRQLILAAKHQSHRNLSRFLFDAGVNLGAEAGRQLESMLRETRQGSRFPVGLWVVPAPSSHKRRRKKAEIVPDIARGVETGLRGVLLGEVRVVPAVSLKPGVGGQEGKSAGVRARGRTGALRLSFKPPTKALVIVVDDVVTTGATMRETCRLFGESAVFALALAAA